MIADDKTKYKKFLINALIEFDSLCKKNNIVYFATGGTALGAVRHKGFIPWDDDIDICMKRNDYDKFLSLKESLQNSRYQIVDYTDEGYSQPSAKFVDTSTTLWEVPNHPIILGAYIDIFPFDYAGGSEIEISVLSRKYRKAWNNYSRSLPYKYLKVIKYHFLKKHYRTFLMRIEDFFFYRFFQKLFYKKFKKVEREVLNKKGNSFLMYSTFYPIHKEIIHEEVLKSVIRVPFENYFIDLPVGYHEYLTNLFGDYMQLPPKEKRISHHSYVFLDLEHRFTIEECRGFINNIF